MDRRVVLGIDPGYDRLGFCVLSGNKNKKDFEILEVGLISSNKTVDYKERLREIHKDFSELVKRHSIDIVSVEQLFWGRNVTSALKVGMVLGAIYTVIPKDVLIQEVHPMKMKKFIAGNGRASKNEIILSIKRRFKIDIKAPDDVWDAIGLSIYGLCYN